MAETIDRPGEPEGGGPDAVHPSPVAGGELDLIAFALLLRRERRTIITSAALAFLLMVVAMLLVAPRFASTTVLLIPQNNPVASSLALKAAVGGLDLIGGGYEIYVDMLHSRTIADRLIDTYGLITVYKSRDEAAAELALSSRTVIDSAKEGLIRVTVEDTDPNRAAAMANSYATELDRLNQTLAVTSAGQQRIFFEREMIKEKNLLADSEVDLQRTQEQTGLVVPEAQAQAGVLAIEQVRAQIRLRQVQLDALRLGATDQNPEVMRLKSEIGGLSAQLADMQSRGGPVSGTAASKVPEKAMEYTRKAREVKFHEAVFELLARQYELAKQQEGRDVSTIQVLDVAKPAKHKTWPPRVVFCLIGLVGGAIFGVMLVLIRAFQQRVLRHPGNRQKFEELLGHASRSR